MMDNGIIVVPTWVPLGVDPGTYAKAADLTAAETKYDAALVNLIDNGPKNRLSVNSGTTGANNGYFVENLPIDLPAGDYHVSMTRTTEGQLTFVFRAADNTELARWSRASGVTTVSEDITLSAAAAKISVYVGNNITVNDAMVCAKAAYAISPAFVPYAPNNAELYAMIQAAQQA